MNGGSAIIGSCQKPKDFGGGISDYAKTADENVIYCKNSKSGSLRPSNLRYREFSVNPQVWGLILFP
jgi:hypothetical protein